MLKNIEHKICFFLIVAFLILFIIACEKEISKDYKNAKDTGTIIPVNLKIMIENNPLKVEALQNINQEFMAKNKDIEVTLVYSDTESNFLEEANKLVSSGMVDIFEYEPFKNYLENPLNNFYLKNDIKKLTTEDFEPLKNYPDIVNNFENKALTETSIIKDEIYGIPPGKVGYNAVFYNKDIFDKNGINKPETWNEFVNICKNLRLKGISPIVCPGNDKHLMQNITSGIINTLENDPFSFVKKLSTGERKINDNRSFLIWSRIDEFLGFFNNDSLLLDNQTAINKFCSGEAAMLIGTTSNTQIIHNQKPNFNFSVFTLPRDQKSEIPTQLSGNYDNILCVYSKSPNKLTAIKWLQFFSEKSNYSSYIKNSGLFPVNVNSSVNTDLNKLWEPYNKNFTLCLKYYEISPYSELSKGYIFPIHALSIFGGNYLSYKDLANELHKSWQEAIKK